MVHYEPGCSESAPSSITSSEKVEKLISDINNITDELMALEKEPDTRYELCESLVSLMREFRTLTMSSDAHLLQHHNDIDTSWNQGISLLEKYQTRANNFQDLRLQMEDVEQQSPGVLKKVSLIQRNGEKMHEFFRYVSCDIYTHDRPYSIAMIDVSKYRSAISQQVYRYFIERKKSGKKTFPCYFGTDYIVIFSQLDMPELRSSLNYVFEQTLDASSSHDIPSTSVFACGLSSSRYIDMSKFREYYAILQKSQDDPEKDVRNARMNLEDYMVARAYELLESAQQHSTLFIIEDN